MNTEQFYPLFLQAENVVIDSRKIEKNDIFFAFSGENFNAATFAEQAVDKGALAVIVEQQDYENPEKNIFYVPSTLEFLQELAVYHRKKTADSCNRVDGQQWENDNKRNYPCRSF